MSTFPTSLFIRVLGCEIELKCQDPRVLELFRQNYAHMECDNSRVPDLEYSIHIDTAPSKFHIMRKDGGSVVAVDDAQLLYAVEKDLTVELQKQRSDLYFLHAAALAFSHNAFLLVAPSGGGKSTTTWGLLHHGFSYLSDELSPVDLTTMEVHGYPHAICFKKEPPAAYPLPGNTIRTPRTLHVPVRQLPVCHEPLPLRCIFFLNVSPEAKSPALRAVSRGETAARLIAQALNPLAHAEAGLVGAATMAESVPAFYLGSADLRLTCDLIKATLEDLFATQPSFLATSGSSAPSY